MPALHPPGLGFLPVCAVCAAIGLAGSAQGQVPPAQAAPAQGTPAQGTPGPAVPERPAAGPAVPEQPAQGSDAAAGEAGAGIPRLLTLEKALEIFRARGFDALVAEASVQSAQGDVSIASGLPNPTLFVSAGKNFQCAASQDCSVISYSGSIFDNNLLSNFVTGKRGLRKDFARAALDAARGSRDDARRMLEFQLKQAYFQALLTRAQREV